MCAAVAQKGVWGVAPSGVRAAAPLSPGKDAGRVCPKALHDAEPAKHTQPLPVGKGFGDRDREFTISFVKQPISVNRLQSDVIIIQ